MWLTIAVLISEEEAVAVQSALSWSTILVARIAAGSKSTSGTTAAAAAAAAANSTAVVS